LNFKHFDVFFGQKSPVQRLPEHIEGANMALRVGDFHPIEDKKQAGIVSDARPYIRLG